MSFLSIHKRLLLWGIFLSVLIALNSPLLANTLAPLETTVVDVIASDMATPEIRHGQGIVIDPAGIIVTNKHIIGKDPKEIQIGLADGHTYLGRVIHNSISDDIAFVKISPDRNLQAISWGDVAAIQIGKKVMALSNAALNAQRQQSGKIIQIYREAASNTVAILEVNIQLNPGDSGGPIVNDQGKLLGIILANQISDRTKSYAITANKIQQEYLKFKDSALISRL